MNNDLINQIRNKVDIVDIIGERIPLVAKGKNFFGVCPFHDDTNPSMSVSREKQIYTCFSCHATGNVFNFLMDYEHMSFPEVLKYLGDRVGIDTGSVNVTKKSTKFDKFYDAYSLYNEKKELSKQKTMRLVNKDIQQAGSSNGLLIAIIVLFIVFAVFMYIVFRR